MKKFIAFIVVIGLFSIFTDFAFAQEARSYNSCAEKLIVYIPAIDPNVDYVPGPY
jgi:hypothetical protein